MEAIEGIVAAIEHHKTTARREIAQLEIGLSKLTTELYKEELTGAVEVVEHGCPSEIMLRIESRVKVCKLLEEVKENILAKV